MLYALSLFLSLGVASVAASASSASRCREVTLSLNGSSENKELSLVTSIADVEAILNGTIEVGTTSASGGSSIAGTFCEPTVKNPNNEKIQVLFASITTNRGSWSAQGGVGVGYPPYQPERYSWVDFANQQGYPTLALDRLGTGKSSHPNGILVAQAPYEIEIYHDLAQQIRQGTTGQLNRSYSHLIWVGNSYGSQLGAGSAAKYPNDWNELVLTGFSKNPLQDIVGVTLALPLPASLIEPAKFGNIPLGYVTTLSKIGRTNSFFGSKEQVSFDDEVAQLFYDRKDVVSLGQFLSIYLYPYNAPSYTGRVLVLTGEQDQAFCGPGSPILGKAHCGSLLAETKSLFPAASYNWKSVDKTGHAIQLHESAQTVFDIAHRFLSGESFQGGPPA